MDLAKEKRALDIIESQILTAINPIVMCSFGKDSIVLLHMCMRFRKLPVLFFRFSRFHEKNLHALKVMQDWDLEVFDMWPTVINDYQNGDFFEILHGYATGDNTFMHLASGIRKRREDETRYLCAVEDLIMRPRSMVHQYPWDVTFHGQKGTDDIEFAAKAPITQPVSQLGLTRLVVPFVDWTDQDIWDYIKAYDVPYDKARYSGNERTSPDVFPTCYKCVDTNYLGQTIMCPMVNAEIPNKAKTPAEHEEFRLSLIGKLQYCEATGESRTTRNAAHL